MTGNDDIRAALRGLAETPYTPNPTPYRVVRARARKVRDRRRAVAGVFSVVALSGLAGTVALAPAHRSVPAPVTGPPPVTASPSPVTTSPSAPPSPGPCGEPTDPAGVDPRVLQQYQTEMTDTAFALENAAAQKYPDVYTSDALIPGSRGLRVYRQPSAAFDRWLGQQFPGLCVEFVNTTHGYRELHALDDRIAADAAYWASRGITPLLITILPTGTVQVGVPPAVVDAARQQFPARYGAGAPLTIVGAQPHYLDNTGPR